MTTRPGYVWDATASEWVEIGQAAVVAPIAYQTSAPSSPATGDIWIDSDDEVPSVDSTLYYRWTKTMSGGETSLSGTDNNSLALKYTPGYESVFINGVLQVRGSDYVATTGTTVTGLIALTANDVVMVESIVAYSVGDTYTQSQISSLLDAKSPVSTTGLVLLASQTIGSAVSSVTVSNVFSSSYDNYRIVVANCTASGAGTQVNFSMNNSTGGTYNWAGNYITYASTTNNVIVGANNSVASICLSGVNNTNNFTMDVLSPFLTTRTTWTTQYSNSGYRGSFGGFDNNAVSQTGFTIVATGITFTGGTIKVYGYK